MAATTSQHPSSTCAVFSAALAIVRGSTDANTRSAASSYLEQWNKTSEAWADYVEWLRACFEPQDASSNNVQEQTGMQLLCLTLLQNKIRREVPKGTAEFPALTSLRQELWRLLLLQTTTETTNNNRAGGTALVSPLCVSTASLTARCGGLHELLTLCCSCLNTNNDNNNNNQLSPQLALKLLVAIPDELADCSSLTTPQSELDVFVEQVLLAVQRSLVDPALTACALETLHAWTQTCHVTVSHLAAIVVSNHNGDSSSLLSMLIQLLSTTTDEGTIIIIMACRALTEALLVPTDSCSPTRQAAVELLVNSISQTGFILNPLHISTKNEHEDACHALSSLVSTLVTEDVDFICAQPCEALLSLLLQLQSHPSSSIPTVLPVLECWLTVQEIPVSDRHSNWTKPLFKQVVAGLIVRVAYPIDHDSSVVVDDEDEFRELRRMVTDVLISSYFLLRHEYLQHMSQLILQQQQQWNAVEAALFGLNQVSREVCARLKARGGGESVRVDKETTAQELAQLVQHLLQSRSTNILVDRAISKFLGSYAPAWSMISTPNDLLQLVSFLQSQNGASSSEETTRAIRSIYVACGSKLVEVPQQLLGQSIQETVGAVLASVASNTASLDSVASVTEGSTRLIMQMHDDSFKRHAMAQLMTLVVQPADQALQAVQGTSVMESNAALEALLKYLRALRTMIQFCEEPPVGSNSSHLLSDTVNATLWPFLERVGLLAATYETILEALLGIHRQLLSNARSLVNMRFSDIVKMVVQALERTKHPSTLEYLSSAVESFSGTEEAAFRDLLSHVTTVVCTYLTTEKRPDECPNLVRAYLELQQRYLMFQSSAFVTCRDFPTIVAFAVESLSACKGEPESTRVALNFLAQLFGWRSLRLSEASMGVLTNAASTIDELLMQCGATVVQACIAGLAGGSPQMLWPSLSDCLFAIVAHITAASIAGPVAEDTTVAHQWIYDALSASCADSSRITPKACEQVMTILFGLAQEGQKARPKAKMLLTDFAKICKGDMNTDVLVSYQLQ